MERKLRRCAVCGSEYKFCPRCTEDKSKPLFYFTFCSENCRDIYDITSKFENGYITATNANTQFKKIDLAKLDNFGTSYKSSINKIMKSTTVITVGNVSDEIIEPTETTDVERNVVDEEKNIRKSRTKKTKNNVEY